jgi:signal transduction histidine kinase
MTLGSADDAEASRVDGVQDSAVLAAPVEPRHRGVGEHWHLRRRIERQLHDGPALRISALTLQLGLLSQKLPGESNLQHDIDDLQDELHLVLQELRALSDQIYPPLLYEAGLAPSLTELANRARIPVRVDARDDRFDPAVEAVAYFVVAGLLDSFEDLSTQVEVRAERKERDLTLDITVEQATLDTHRGAAALEQIRRLGAVVEILPAATGGTIRVRVPCG